MISGTPAPARAGDLSLSPVGSAFDYEAPANSLTVIRIKTQGL